MAADTNSTLLGLLLQGTGNNNNSWGANLNDFVFTYLENALAGYTTKSVTGGAATLTAAQHRSGMIEFTGTLSSNSTVTVDNTSKHWRFFNNTSGSYVLLVKTASGTAIEIPQGTQKDVWCDGSDHLYRLDANQVGRIIMHGGTSAPAGTLACAGSTFVRADHPDLFTAIGTTWGSGNGVTTAGLPDFATNNRFMRASGGSLSVGTYQSNQNASHTHTITGTPGVGTLAVDSGGSHTHTATSTSTDAGHTHYVTNTNEGGVYGGTGGGTPVYYQAGSNSAKITTSGAASITTTTTVNSGGSHTHTVSGALTAGSLATASSGSSEARPENGAVLVCIVI